MSSDSTDIFATHFETLALDEKTLASGHGTTIVPESMIDAFAEPLDRLRSLPRLALGASPGTHPDLHVLGTLGSP